MFPPEGEKVAKPFHVCGSAAGFFFPRMTQAAAGVQSTKRWYIALHLSLPALLPITSASFPLKSQGLCLWSQSDLWPLLHSEALAGFRWTENGQKWELKTQTQTKNNIWLYYKSTHGPSVSSTAFHFSLLWGAKTCDPELWSQTDSRYLLQQQNIRDTTL